MANAATAAGDNGVAGTLAAGLGNDYGAITGTLAAGDKECEGFDEAIRHSVARTQGGTFEGGTDSNGNRSEVFSVTQGLRFAYTGVEADTPAIDRTA